MFKLMETETFVAPVVIHVPTRGGHKPTHCKGEFLYKTQREIEELLGLTPADDPDTEDKTLLGEVLRGWSGFADHEGKEIAYDDENRAQALDTPFVRAGFVRAYMKAINGQQSGRKN